MTAEGNQKLSEALDKNGKTRVGLAIQGGVVPAGAFAAGVLKGLVEKGAFDQHNICAFSGTSAGAVIATLCWGHTLNGSIDKLGDDLTRQWTYLQWPRHLALLPIWTPKSANTWTAFDALAMHTPLWRLFVEKVRTPFIRWIMTKWIEDLIPIEELNEKFRGTYPTAGRAARPGLVLGSADVLRGEIKTFREEDLSLAAVLASGSLDEMGGVTTIVTPPHAGTYLDGAWADNPPINELLDYHLEEIWIIQCFPKAIPTAPRTPAERKERKDELWQNSLVEHERQFVDFVNRWHDAINAAVLSDIEERQKSGELPGTTPTDPALVAYLQKMHDQNGKLPKHLDRLFDEWNGFAPKEYKKVKIKTIEIMMPRESGSAIVNAPWFIRNLMRLGYQQALDFADREFDDKAAKRSPAPAGLRPARWATIPSPANDVLYGFKPARSVADALDLVCDLCPRKAASTAGELFLDVLPTPVKGTLKAADQAICAMCPKTVMSKLAA